MTQSPIFSYALTAVVFLVIISILVAAHEYGHYIFARLFGMGVEEFAIGMGKKLKIWRKTEYDVPVGESYEHQPEQLSMGAAFEGGTKVSSAKMVDTAQGSVLRDETEFTIRALPIGGFVRIKGMIPHDDGSETKIPGGFYSKPPWQRLIVLVAGPAASVLAGLVVLVLLFMTYGSRKPIQEPLLGSVSNDGPAAQAGLKAGDVIVSIGGQPVHKFYDMVRVVYESVGRDLPVTYRRNDKLFSTKVKPKEIEGPTLTPTLELSPEAVPHGVIGVSYDSRLVVLGFADATREAVRAPVEAVGGIFRIAKRPSRIKDEAGGAITMVAATHAAVEEGLGTTIWLAAMLSISVGIFNLLPLPPLDGGQMAMAFAELLRGGRRLSIKVQQAVTSAGFLLVLLLFVVVMFVDVQRFTTPPPKPVSKPPVTQTVPGK